MNCPYLKDSTCKLASHIKGKEVKTTPEICQSCFPKNPSLDNYTFEIISLVDGKPQKPSFVEQVINYGHALVDYAKDGFQDVSDEIYQERLSICKSCEFYDKEQNKCSQCGCTMAGESGFKSKLRMANQSCPLPEPRWTKIE